MVQVVKIPYSPRKLQAYLHDNLKRFSVVVCHRRFGKTVMAVNHLLRAALTTTNKSSRFAYMAPTYRQAKSVAWDYLKFYAHKVPGAKFHETELRCDLPNGSRISLLGAENPDSLRGIFLDGIVMDEYADMPERVFGEVVRPALVDRKGFCFFVGTPRGQNNFYKLYQESITNPKWFSKVYRASQTKILPKDELEAAKAIMTENQFEQEFECSFVANVEGAIYGKPLDQALHEKRITKVPYDEGYPVSTFWDLGIADATAIWFVQVIGHAVHVINYYKAKGEGLKHYCEVLNTYKYLYQHHYAPHDIDVRELGTGKSRREIAMELGLNFKIVPKLPIEDGIHAAQQLISRCWFDTKNCEDGLQALRQYHRVYDEKTQSFRTRPKHDWSSHSADAFRYMGIGLDTEEGFMRKPKQNISQQEYNPFTMESLG